jgi:hypothetical protein
MSFTGKEGGPISRETAKSWIKNYQDSESAQNPEKVIIRAHFFGKEKIQKLLNEDGCVGIRIYYGKDEKGDQKLLLIAVKEDMDDIAPTDMNRASEDGPMILDLSWPCPPYCGDTDI